MNIEDLDDVSAQDVYNGFSERMVKLLRLADIDGIGESGVESTDKIGKTLGIPKTNAFNMVKKDMVPKTSRLFKIVEYCLLRIQMESKPDVRRVCAWLMYGKEESVSDPFETNKDLIHLAQKTYLEECSRNGVFPDAATFADKVNDIKAFLSVINVDSEENLQQSHRDYIFNKIIQA